MAPLSIGVKLYKLTSGSAKLAEPLPEGLDPDISKARQNTGQNLVAVLKTDDINDLNKFI